MKKIKEEYLFLSIVLVGMIARFHTLGARSLWMDELRQVNYYLSESIFEVIINASKQSQPPFDYLIGYFLLRVFDYSEALVRFPAFFFGTLTIVLVYSLTKYLFSKKAALLAAFLTCFSTILVEYSQEARPYAIFVFFLLLTLLQYLKAISENKRKYWVYFSVSLFGVLMARGLSPLVFFLCLIVNTLFFFTVNKVFSFHQDEFSKNKMLCSLGLSSLVFLLYSPFFYIILNSPVSLTYVPEPLGFSPGSYLKTLLEFPLATGIEYFEKITKPLTLFYPSFGALGIISIFHNKPRRPALFFFLGIVFSMPLAQLFIMSEKHLEFFLRYFVDWLPFIYILTGAGIFFLFEMIEKKLSTPKPFFTVSTIGVLVLVLSVSGSQLNHYYRSTSKTDWKKASEHLKRLIGKDDVVLTESFGAYGYWDPGFYGGWLYFQKPNPVLNIDRLTTFILQNPEKKKGNIFLLFFSPPIWELA
ncbi:MAG: glycosyltransferase family 39 protein [Nitrospinota bacterium]